MTPSSWSWTTLVLTAGLYWMLVAAWWVARLRRKARTAEPRSTLQKSETTLEVTFEEKIPLFRMALVLLGPPLLLVMLRLVARG